MKRLQSEHPVEIPHIYKLVYGDSIISPPSKLSDCGLVFDEQGFAEIIAIVEEKELNAFHHCPSHLKLQFVPFLHESNLLFMLPSFSDI